MSNMSNFASIYCVFTSRSFGVRAFAVAFFVCFAAVQSINAATFTVDTTTDDVALSACTDATANDCSLRGAITAANVTTGADIIILPAETYTLTVASTNEDANADGDLDITANSGITLNGANARTTIIQAGTVGGVNGNGIDRVFDILAGGSLSLDNVTVRNGRVGTAGGGIRSGGNLIVNHTTVANNRTTGTSGGGGFEILTASNTTILDSTISGNSINASSGGGIRTIGSAQVFIANTTISGNTAAQTGGGGIRAQSGAGGLLTITNCTITGNALTANTGGGLSNSNTMRIRNTIVSGNTAGGNPDVSGTFASGGTNLIGVQGTSSGWMTTGATADLLNNPNANPGALQNNGGATDTHSVAAGSAALNAGQNCVVDSSCITFNAPANLTNDQRDAGFARQQDANVDIGAFELQAGTTAAGVNIGGRVRTAKGQGIIGVVITLTDMSGNSRTVTSSAFGYYHFNDVKAGETYIVTAKAKRCTFGQSSQVVNASDNLDGINFTAN